MVKYLRKVSLYVFLIVTIFSINSCINNGDELLDPKLTFSIGSEPFTNAETIALKGNIEFENSKTSHSGSFKFYSVGKDSIYFLLEGPLRVDVFEMLIIDNDAYTIAKSDSYWNHYDADDMIDIAEYGLFNISFSDLGYFILPQYFLNYTGNTQLSFDNSDYFIRNNGTKKSFSISKLDSDLVGSYSNKKVIQDGFYPSKIDLFSLGEEWVIKIKINKVKINPKIPNSIWKRFIK